jgi:hypothetical protein
MIMHPEILEKAEAEIDRVIGPEYAFEYYSWMSIDSVSARHVPFHWVHAVVPERSSELI